MGRHGRRHEVDPLDAVGYAGGGHQLLGLGDVGRLVRAVPGKTLQLLQRAGELAGVGHPPGEHDRLLGAERLDEVLTADGQVDGSPHAGIVEGLALVVDVHLVGVELARIPDRPHDVLALEPLLVRLERDVRGVVRLPGEHRGAPVRPRRDVQQLQPVQIGKLGIPVVGIPHHHPLLGHLPLLEHEGPGAGGDDLAEILVVLVQSLLGVDDHRRWGEQLEEVGPGLLEGELHREAVDGFHLLDRRELILVEAGHSRRREDDAGERGHHVGRAERHPVVELHSVPQLNRTRLLSIWPSTNRNVP